MLDERVCCPVSKEGGTGERRGLDETTNTLKDERMFKQRHTKHGQPFWQKWMVEKGGVFKFVFSFYIWNVCCCFSVLVLLFLASHCLFLHFLLFCAWFSFPCFSLLLCESSFFPCFCCFLRLLSCLVCFSCCLSWLALFCGRSICLYYESQPS